MGQNKIQIIQSDFYHVIQKVLLVDEQKVFEKGNRSASIRARKYAQEIKQLVGVYRKEILEEIKKHDDVTTD